TGLLDDLERGGELPDRLDGRVVDAVGDLVGDVRSVEGAPGSACLCHDIDTTTPRAPQQPEHLTRAARRRATGAPARALPARMPAGGRGRAGGRAGRRAA